MRAKKIVRVIPLLSTLLLAGCSTLGGTGKYADRSAGFTEVTRVTEAATGKATVWVQNQQQANAAAEQVRSLVYKKTISADTAVQVALLNNKGLQAAYAEIGLSAADVWQEAFLENPTVSVGVLGIATPGLGLFRAIEGIIANNILAMATRDRRIEIADVQFRQAQLRAANETLRLAADTRRAWIRAVSAFETVYYLNQGQAAADAASELARKLGESGAMPKGEQAREHAFYAELTGQKAQANLAAKLAKEDLTRLMGLWGAELDYFVPDQLPGLPGKLAGKDAIEREALSNRVDLQIAKLELDLAAKSYGLTEATRYVTDLEVISGVELEREIDTEYELDGGTLNQTKSLETKITPQVEFDFVIPIFDSGQARLRKAELTYMRAANLLAEQAVNIRSEARSAYTAYRATYDIARHYKNSVLPLRVTIEEEALLTYNGMISNTFELLADTRAKISTLLDSVNAKRDFWLADADLSTAIFGGGAATSGGEAIAMVDSGSGGH
ncbi:MAG: TolC family protein [Devosia sp.]